MDLLRLVVVDEGFTSKSMLAVLLFSMKDAAEGSGVVLVDVAKT